jgi:hypothetical protein
MGGEKRHNIRLTIMQQTKQGCTGNPLERAGVAQHSPIYLARLSPIPHSFVTGALGS